MGRTSDARERLIESAKELFWSRSYTAVGVNDLCEHAGVKKGSFYHFFDSKRDLALAMIDEVDRMSIAVSDGVADSGAVGLDWILGYIEKSGGSICGEKTVRGCPLGNLALELSTQDEIIRRRLREIFDARVSFFSDALTKAMEAGQIEDVDPDETAWGILAWLQGAILLAKCRNDPELPERLAGMVRRLARARAEYAEG